MAVTVDAPAAALLQDEEEEDDYMSMAIAEPTKPYEKETYTQRRMRKQREAENKNPKSKAQLEAEAAAAREKALSTALPPTSKGFKMLSKFGFQPGESLGAKNNPNARTEPIELDMKIDRGGIGMDSEKKRKFKGAVEDEAKRAKVDEGDFRERVSREREAERLERQAYAAMKVAERMDEEERQSAGETGDVGVAAELAPVVEEKEGLVPEQKVEKPLKSVPTKQVNVLWRGLVRGRVEKERNRRMRHDLMQSLSRNPNYNDDKEGEKDALGTEEEELEEEDPELEEFNALEPGERLRRLVEHLRDRYHYCFWCKYRYEDDKMGGCPGLTEEEHD